MDRYDFLLLDDLGYLSQGAEESEVLFTLIAERYEHRSLGITSNLVFSQWEHIFANPMATAAAIDRVVHHSVILEFDVPSYRTSVAQQRSAQKVNRQIVVAEQVGSRRGPGVRTPEIANSFRSWRLVRTPTWRRDEAPRAHPGSGAGGLEETEAESVQLLNAAD